MYIRTHHFMFMEKDEWWHSIAYRLKWTMLCYEDECYKTVTRHKNDQQQNKTKIATAWDMYTHTNSMLFFPLGSRRLACFLDYNFYMVAFTNWDKKNRKAKFNFVNVNAKSNCFGTLTICVRSWMPTAHFTSV